MADGGRTGNNGSIPASRLGMGPTAPTRATPDGGWGKMGSLQPPPLGAAPEEMFMRRWVVLAVLPFLWSLSLPAAAEGINNFLIGVNGLITFPADPVMMVVTPSEELEDMPGFPVTGRVAGLIGGTGLGVIRLIGGVYDVVFTPVWVFPSMSPPPRFYLVPGIEEE